MKLLLAIRRRWRWIAIFGVFAAFAVWLEPTRVVWGWLRGEAFYQGRPTSYWSAEIDRWFVGLSEGGGFVDADGTIRMTDSYMRTPTVVEERLGRWISMPEKPWPQLLDGDPEGRAVLDELLFASSATVRTWAAEGLGRLDSGEKGPHRSYRTKLE